MLRLGTSGLAVLALVGCSPVKDASNVPDAPIDSTDMRPPMIASSNPAANATKVSILQPVTVFMDEALDPDSVNEITVKLGYFANFPPPVFPGHNTEGTHGPIPAGLQYVKGTVSYDPAGKKISFVPAAPLPYGYVFTLELNVKDTAGIEAKTALNFTTYINAPVKQFFFNGTNGNPSGWLGFPVDTVGRPAKRVGGNAAGPDTIWFTSDDPKTNQRTDYKYDPDGRPLDERLFNTGGDGVYDTPDDVLAWCARYTYNAQKQMTERTYTSTPGTDAVLCTPDDVPNTNTIYTYTDNVMTGFVNYTAPGTDNTWRTPDDRCGIYFDYQYDAQGNKTREIYRGCGGDAMPRTADDTYGYYWAYEYDANGYQTKRTFYGGPGADNMWLTGDDAINQVDRYVRNEAGLVTDQYESFGPGPDMMWGTMDDPGYHWGNKYNAKQLTQEITFYTGIGPDNMWDTMDDVTNNYQLFTYDELGNRTDSKVYTRGADGQWKTPDDRISTDFDYDLAH